MQCYRNLTLYTGYRTLQRANIWMDGIKVVAISEDPSFVPENIGTLTQDLDLQGMCATAGFVDLQIYGGNGKLFNSEPTVEAIAQTYASIRAGGAEYFQITLSSVPYPIIWRAIEACRAYWAGGGQGLLGLHLEGPYFNPEKRGAHPLTNIRTPVYGEVAELLERGAGVVSYITVAPEQFDDATLDLLLKSGVNISAGHSNATFGQAMRGFERGIGRATHLFNAMSQFQSRAPGMVGAVYTAKPWASIIADGIHCDFAALAVSKAVLGDKLFLITDAVTQSEQGDYRFQFKGDRYVDASGTLAGSSLTMWQAVRNCVQQAGIPLDEALRMANLYPARVVGMEHKIGALVPGRESGIVVFDPWTMELCPV